MSMEEGFNLIRYLTSERDKGIIIWLCNIGAEKYWNKVNAGIIDRTEDIIVNRVEEMNLLICREQDFMILRTQPEKEYLDMLRSLGFSIPRILTLESDDTVTPISELILKDEKLQAELSSIAKNNTDVFFVPYGVTTLEEQIAQKCNLRIMGAPSGVNSRINDKIFNREIAESLGFEVCKGKICRSVEEIREEYNNLINNEPSFSRVIIKEPYGASGKGLYIVDSEQRLKSILTRIARFSRGDSESRWLVEGWYEKESDLNYQIYVSPKGEVDVFSIKQQVLRDTVYIGSKVPPDVDGETIQRYKECGVKIGKYLYEIGFTGVAGIDSIIASGCCMIPIIEINGRFTLSTYISFIQYVLGEIKMLTRYFRLITNETLNYAGICSKLNEKGILYDRNKGEGVIVYTSGTLPSENAYENNVYNGRLFTLIISSQWHNIEKYNAQLEETVKEISKGYTA